MIEVLRAENAPLAAQLRTARAATTTAVQRLDNIIDAAHLPRARSVLADVT